MTKWFSKQSKIVQIILLFVPVVNWVLEICLRFEAWQNAKGTKGLIYLILFIISLPGGLLFGWIDVIWVLLFNHLFLTK